MKIDITEINITKENKDKLLQLIAQLVEAENQELKRKATDERDTSSYYVEYSKYMNKPQNDIGNLLVDGSIELSEFGFGMSFLFNSFFAAKAMLRVIANLTNEKKKPIEKDLALDIFSEAAIARGLQRYNGFPKERPKKHERSGVTRLTYSVILPLSKIGMLKIDGTKLILTKEGFNFAMLYNPKLDENKGELFSEEERDYIIDYLKEIEMRGFKEYSFLKQIVDFIKKKTTEKRSIAFVDLIEFLKGNQSFIDYIYKNTKFSKKGIPKESKVFLNKVERIIRVILASRIAILRELKIIEDRRNSYRIIDDILR